MNNYDTFLFKRCPNNKSINKAKNKLIQSEKEFNDHFEIENPKIIDKNENKLLASINNVDKIAKSLLSNNKKSLIINDISKKENSFTQYFDMSKNNVSAKIKK